MVLGTERYMGMFAAYRSIVFVDLQLSLTTTAPEQHRPGYTHKSDVFAFGVLLNELYTGGAIRRDGSLSHLQCTPEERMIIITRKRRATSTIGGVDQEVLVSGTRSTSRL